MQPSNNPFAYGDTYSAGNPFANIGGQPYQYSDSALIDLSDAGLKPGNITEQPLSGSGGNMGFPFMAAATVAAPIIGGIFGGQREASRRQGIKDLTEFQNASQADQLLASFGAQNMFADAEAARQLGVGINKLNLMNSAPYVASDFRSRIGPALAGKYGPAQVATFNDLFGGYA
jgi:hypothetical protein